MAIFELITLPFFERAAAIGLIIGILMSILGVLVVLRRMSFFSDAIGHSALTGIAIAVLTGINPFIGALAFTIFIAASIVGSRHYTKLHLDTLLGVFFPTAVAVGVILLRFSSNYRTDLISFLFGDILTVSTTDIWLSLGLAVLVGIVIWQTGKKLITIALNEELAHTQGINIPLYELLFLITLAAVITMGIKIIGVILITAILIIPAATAQNLARSITSMFIISVIISVLSTSIGMLLSAWLNVPSGPAIVLAAAGFFVISFIIHKVSVQS